MITCSLPEFRIDHTITKPLIRWTIGGNVSGDGMLCLKQSIISWSRLYDESIDRVICHNGLNRQRLAYIESVAHSTKSAVLWQGWHAGSLPVPPSSTAWKLYPPRLRLSAPEIIIDNDLVIHNKHSAINDLLADNKPFISEALTRSYGIYTSVVRSPRNMNSGFIGLPRHYDFQTELIKNLIGPWDNYFDEQGLVTTTIETIDPTIIPLSDISVCITRYEPGLVGVHFVGLNKGDRRAWSKYRHRKGGKHV